MIRQYEGFAALYDSFMGDVDYDGWVSYIERIWEKFGLAPKAVLDLGCGTGNASGRLAAKGYDVMGLDKSADMLSVAKAKHPNIFFINRDARSFELLRPVDAVISLCDVFNYLLKARDLHAAFVLAEKYLNPGGMFIFDLNTIHKYRERLGNRVFFRQTKDAALIWENRYYKDERINDYRLTFFQEQESGLYKRFNERHLQRAYRPERIVKLLTAANLEFLGFFGDKTFLAPKKDEERIFFVARKPFIMI